MSPQHSVQCSSYHDATVWDCERRGRSHSTETHCLFCGAEPNGLCDPRAAETGCGLIRDGKALDAIGLTTLAGLEPARH